jgi:hypothetical protein
MRMSKPFDFEELQRAMAVLAKKPSVPAISGKKPAVAL